MLFGSTTHEAKESPYHASKREGRARFDALARGARHRVGRGSDANAFGPGGRPFYNSVVSTFCKLRAEGRPLEVHPGAGSVKLIAVDTLAEALFRLAVEPAPENPGRDSARI